MAHASQCLQTSVGMSQELKTYQFVAGWVAGGTQNIVGCCIHCLSAQWRWGWTLPSMALDAAAGGGLDPLRPCMLYLHCSCPHGARAPLGRWARHHLALLTPASILTVLKILKRLTLQLVCIPHCQPATHFGGPRQTKHFTSAAVFACLFDRVDHRIVS